MDKRSQIENAAYKLGFFDGVKCFAHYKDGIEYVGTTGMTFKQARENLENLWNYRPPNNEPKDV